MRPLLPDLDIWLTAFDRRAPIPSVVNELAHAVEQRQIFLLGWVRQGLIARAADAGNAERVARALAPFPDIPILRQDHEAAAFLTHRLHKTDVAPSPARALAWVMARRIGGKIWSRNRTWLPLHSHGCPVVTDPSA